MGSKRGSAGIESLSGERVQEEEYLARFVLLHHLHQPRMIFSTGKLTFRSLFLQDDYPTKGLPLLKLVYNILIKGLSAMRWIDLFTWFSFVKVSDHAGSKSSDACGTKNDVPLRRRGF